LVSNLLAQEHDGEAAARVGVERGRTYHRDWVRRTFGIAQDGVGPEADRGLVDALVAATDLYVWKLLRLDLRRSVEATEATMARLARGVLNDGAAHALEEEAHERARS